MQSVAISIPPPGNSPNPAAASLSPATGQLASPFSALFQMQLSTAGGAAKLPAPGKPKDSARAPDFATAGLNFLQIVNPLLGLAVLPPVLPVAVLAAPASGTLLDNEPCPNPTVAPANQPLPQSSISVVTPDDQPSPAILAPVLTAVDLQSVASSNSVVAATKDPLPTFPTLIAEASQNEVTPQDPPGAPSESQSPPADLPIPTATVPIELGLQPVSDPSTVAIAPGPQTQDAIPVQAASTDTYSASQSQDPNHSNTPQPDSKTIASNNAVLPYIRAIQVERAGLDLKNLQTAGWTRFPASSPEQVPQTSTPDISAKPISNPQSGTAAVAAPTPAQTATKMTAVGVPTPAVQDLLKSQAVNGSQAAPNVKVTPKLQLKDPSSGSQGGETNTKSDHATNVAVVHADGNGFSQAVDTASATAGNTHAVAPDSTAATSDVRMPIELRPASVDQKADPSSALQSQPGQSVPAASTADQPIVSTARLLDHPGQTEIRIEMQAGSLGVVELRAHISGDQIGASIAVEHHDARLMLTNDLPALHSALAEKDLRVNTLSVSQGMGASMGGNHGGDAGQRGFSPSHPKPIAYMTQEEIPVPAMNALAESLDASRTSAGLSVLA